MKLTKKQILTFKDEAHKWINAFGLIAWRVYWLVEPIKDSLATCAADPISRAVTFTISDDWKHESSEYELRRVAFHEVCHLLTTRIAALAMYRHTTEEEIDEELHAIIRTLEAAVFEDQFWRRNAKELPKTI